MKRFFAALAVSVLVTAGCTLPEGGGSYRHCISDSGICWFEDHPQARRP